MATEPMLVQVGYVEQDDPTVCGAPACSRELNPRDHVTMFTTRHVRRFCCVECLVESNDAYWTALVERAV